MGWPVAKPMRSNQNLRASWKAVNPQDCVLKTLYRTIMRTILQEKGDNSLQHYNMVHKFIPMPQAMEDSRSKSSSGWPGGLGSPRHVPQQAAADSRGVPEPACVQTPWLLGWHTQGEKDELTSCRGTVQSAWQYLQWVAKEGEPGCSQKGKWPPRGTGTTVLTYPGMAPR